MALRRLISKSDAYINFFNGKGAWRKTINNQVQQHAIRIQCLRQKKRGGGGEGQKRNCINDALNQQKFLTATGSNRCLHSSSSAIEIQLLCFQSLIKFTFFPPA